MVDETLIGRVVVKTRGRDAGCKGVVVAVYSNGYVLVTGPKQLTGLRRRRVNTIHIIPTSKKIDIPKDASDEEVMKTIKEAGLEKYMTEGYEIKPSSMAAKI
ncbi:MAG: 50S ribosomal protein L14e [Candidatus Caldarchaeum sp.]|nr:50S ribosomal protein L14e [Candidatus Caldarchaeum sp.]